MTLLIKRFLASKASWRKSTRTTCKRHLGYWQKWLNGRKLEDVTVSDFEGWTGEKGWSDSMTYNSLWAIKGYLGWLKLDHPLLEHLVERIIPPLQHYIKLSEVQQLKNACDVNSPKGLRDATIISFLWETWARASEVITAKVNDLNLEDQEVSLYRSKVNDWHNPAFGPDLRNLFEKWLPVRSKLALPETETIFINIVNGTPLSYTGLYEILKSVETKTGIKVSAHPFRRGGARHHASYGRNAREGLEQGGWRSWQMYWRYTRGVSLDWFKKKSWDDENDNASIH